MNIMKRKFTQSATMGLMAWSLTTAPVFAEDKDCWVDFFEESQYRGQHALIQGPAQLKNLNNLQGEDWSRRIHSLKVGPKANVTLYQNPDFQLSTTAMAKSPEQMQALGITEQDIKEDSELIFNENANIHDLGDFAFHKKVQSLKVGCR
jgi:Beta/Gamma crystallin